jgi:hypothetical protein
MQSLAAHIYGAFLLFIKVVIIFVDLLFTCDSESCLPLWFTGSRIGVFMFDLIYDLTLSNTPGSVYLALVFTFVRFCERDGARDTITQRWHSFLRC